MNINMETEFCAHSYTLTVRCILVSRWKTRKPSTGSKTKPIVLGPHVSLLHASACNRLLAIVSCNSAVSILHVSACNRLLQFCCKSAARALT